jgi:hypothetical protein
MSTIWKRGPGITKRRTPLWFIEPGAGTGAEPGDGRILTGVCAAGTPVLASIDNPQGMKYNHAIEKFDLDIGIRRNVTFIIYR